MNKIDVISKRYDKEKIKVGIFWLVFSGVTFLINTLIGSNSDFIAEVLGVLTLLFFVMGILNFRASNTSKVAEHIVSLTQTAELEKQSEDKQIKKKLLHLISKSSKEERNYIFSTAKISKSLVMPIVLSILFGFVGFLDESVFEGETGSYLIFLISSIVISIWIIYLLHSEYRWYIMAKELTANPSRIDNIQLKSKDIEDITFDEYETWSEWRYKLYQIIKAYFILISTVGSVITIALLFMWLGSISIAPTTVILILLIMLLMKN